MPSKRLHLGAFSNRINKERSVSDKIAAPSKESFYTFPGGRKERSINKMK